GRDFGDFEEEVQQLAALLEEGGGGHRGEPAPASSRILTLALAPMRVAPAALIFWKSSQLRMPPAALMPISPPTTRCIRATSWAVAPEGPKPVEVFTNSALASRARAQTRTFCSSERKAASMMTFTIAPP